MKTVRQTNLQDRYEHLDAEQYAETAGKDAKDERGASNRLKSGDEVADEWTHTEKHIHKADSLVDMLKFLPSVYEEDETSDYPEEQHSERAIVTKTAKTIDAVFHKRY